MKTYFVTACVYAFLNAYRAWRTERERWNSELMFEPGDVEPVYQELHSSR